MKQVTVVCVALDREATVGRLADLGIVHVTEVAPADSPELDELSARVARAERAGNLLQSRKVKGAGAAGGRSPEEAIKAANDLADELAGCHEQIAHWRRVREAVEPWGSVAGGTLEALRASGVTVKLCRGPEAQVPVLPEGAVVQVISRRKATLFYVVAAAPGVDLGEGLPEVLLPEETDLAVIDRKLAEFSRRKGEIGTELDALAGARKAVAAGMTRVSFERDVVRAREGMGSAEGVAYLQGYVPARHLKQLRSAAAADGWGLLLSEPDAADERVPTLLTVPRIFRMAKPIFDFIGILPGYREVDVSISVLIFLTIFFGMIVGDAGYGILFLGLGIWLKRRPHEPRKQLPINLFLTMSVVTIVWGGLTGNYFAIPSDRLPGVLRGLPALSTSPGRDANVQLLCFFIGATHLSLARFWQALIRRNRLEALGHVGWAYLIWGNYFTALALIVPGTSFPPLIYWVYGIGVVLILAFGVQWRDVGDVLNLPFSFIGSFVDVLSYIRLFAVGLASFYIAKTFNNMGIMVYDLSPVLVPAAVLIIVLGHLLNIALGFMGVLVHGIRLNTLEFSNHMGLAWSGRLFSPLHRPQAEVNR